MRPAVVFAIVLPFVSVAIVGVPPAVSAWQANARMTAAAEAREHAQELQTAYWKGYFAGSADVLLHQTGATARDPQHALIPPPAGDGPTRG